PCAPSSLATSLPLVRRLPPGQARLRRRAVAHRFPWVQRLPSCLAVRLLWRGGRAVECGGLENRFGRSRPTRVQIPPPPLNTAVRLSRAHRRTDPAQSESVCRYRRKTGAALREQRSTRSLRRRARLTPRSSVR